MPTLEVRVMPAVATLITIIIINQITERQVQRFQTIIDGGAQNYLLMVEESSAVEIMEGATLHLELFASA
jgi:hypothetical protein